MVIRWDLRRSHFGQDGIEVSTLDHPDHIGEVPTHSGPRPDPVFPSVGPPRGVQSALLGVHWVYLPYIIPSRARGSEMDGFGH